MQNLDVTCSICGKKHWGGVSLVIKSLELALVVGSMDI